MSDHQGTVFNDPVHGHIELHPLMVKFIDTPEFQRLRYIKQLGGTDYVFPGASHSRFEHSIGVCYLAGELVETLQRKQPELEITHEDVLCVKLAGLCHDLGHGPFSHLFDGKFIPRVLPMEKQKKHEDVSVMMLEHLIKENKLKKDMKEYGLKVDAEQWNDITFIKELIIGSKQDETCSDGWPYKGRADSKGFLYEIVANKRTGVDVDKWDYFARDCHYLGIANSFDLRRFIKFVRVIKKQICIRDKEATNLYDMFHTRCMLHRRAYQHKTTEAVQLMITDALVEANKFVVVLGKDGKPKKMSEAIDDPIAFTGLTDKVLEQIQFFLCQVEMQSEILDTKQLQYCREAEGILKRIKKRKLYTYIGRVQVPNTCEKKASDICKEMEEMGAREIAVVIATFDYGKKDKNPVDKVGFYKKDTLDRADKLCREEVSAMLPAAFMEKQIRVFCKKDDAKLSDCQATWKYFEKWCEKYPEVLTEPSAEATLKKFEKWGEKISEGLTESSKEKWKKLKENVKDLIECSSKATRKDFEEWSEEISKYLIESSKAIWEKFEKWYEENVEDLAESSCKEPWKEWGERICKDLTEPGKEDWEKFEKWCKDNVKHLTEHSGKPKDFEEWGEKICKYLIDSNKAIWGDIEKWCKVKDLFEPTPYKPIPSRSWFDPE